MRIFEILHSKRRHARISFIGMFTFFFMNKFLGRKNTCIFTDLPFFDGKCKANGTFGIKDLNLKNYGWLSKN